MRSATAAGCSCRGAEDANHRAPPGSGAHPTTGILRTIDEMAEQHANIARL